MARQARIVVPNQPHHVIQRGNRRQDVFFSDSDYRGYLRLLREHASKSETEIWAYCLMPNHVHLILVPSNQDGLRATMAGTHRGYTQRINQREDWTGHLWQDRFQSFPMDETYFIACAHYIEMNPVQAGLAKWAQSWPWSSATSHINGASDGVVEVEPLLSLVPDWRNYLEDAPVQDFKDKLVRHATAGRPMGSDGWLAQIEDITGRNLQTPKRGRPRKQT